MIFLILIILISTQNILSQIDTESLRKVDMKVGHTQNLLTNIGLRKGNTEFFSLGINYRNDYLTDKYHAYGVASLAYQDNQFGVFQRSGFIHIRYLQKWAGNFWKEAYTQKQFDYFQRLKDRNIIGGGMRYNIDINDSSDKRIFHLYAGTGIMYENELLNIKENYSTNLIRSSSYLNLSWIPNNDFNISSVIYYQWDLFNSEDYRILSISSINFRFNKSLSFVFQFNYRYDSDPPIREIKKYDYELRNGIKFEF